MATLADLEARIAALEAAQADYRAVLAAINPLGENQREQSQRLGNVETGLVAVEQRLGSVSTTASDTNARVRSLEDGQAEVRDLLIRALDR